MRYPWNIYYYDNALLTELRITLHCAAYPLFSMYPNPSDVFLPVLSVLSGERRKVPEPTGHTAGVLLWPMSTTNVWQPRAKRASRNRYIQYSEEGPLCLDTHPHARCDRVSVDGQVNGTNRRNKCKSLWLQGFERKLEVGVEGWFGF